MYGKLVFIGLGRRRLWANWINKAGDLLLGGRRYPVEIHAFGWRYDTQKVIEGVQHRILKKCLSIAEVEGKRFPQSGIL